MIELNKILSDGRWGDVAAFINANFEKVRVELLKLRHASILTFCKGYFSTESRFLEKYPTGKTGEYAFVGTPWPGTVYEWQDTAWVDTGVVPQLGEAVFIELLKRHIDNETIYWDAGNEVIRSQGGGGDTRSITVDIAASSVGRCTVTATGDVAQITPNAEENRYIILVPVGGSVTVNVVPAEGYQMKSLTVDGIGKGASGSHTFEKVREDHTVSAEVEIIEVIPVDFLTRSDLPGVFYSSTQSVFDSLKSDYPGGLTRDVTITCVKPAREKRSSGVWVAYLEEWNIRTMYTLTVDGANLLLYDGKSLGCLMFRQVDNVIVKNTGFVNFANGVEATAPDASFAIYCWGSNTFRCANLYVDNCVFDGGSTVADKMAASTLSCMNVDNVTVNGCQSIKNYGYTFTITDCGMVSMVKNTISVENSLGVVSHPAAVEVSSAYRLVFEDNEISGDIRESYVNLNNVDYIYFRRNRLHDGGGEALNVGSLLGTRELVIESNLFYGLLMNPVGGWMKHYINPGTVSSMRVCNNTFCLSGEFYEQYAIRYGIIGELYLYNNIVVKAADKVIHAFAFESIGKLHSGNNLYRFEYNPANDSVSGAIIMTTSAASPVSIPQGISHHLSRIQALDYEQNSAFVEMDTVLLSSGYAITAQYDALYKADDTEAPFADADYKEKAASGNSRGCYNLAGTAIDEDSHVTGYTGYDLESATSFSAEKQYPAMAESILMLTHHTPDRRRFVRYSVVGPVHQYLLLGKYCMLAASPVLDDAGEYLEDELYTIKIVQE